MSENVEPVADVTQDQTTEVVTDEKKHKLSEITAELGKKSSEELVNLLLETKNEAKTKRFKIKELKETIANFEKQKDLDATATLEKNQEFEVAYNGLKEKTADYEDLKNFKQNYLEECKSKIDIILPTLQQADLELFELSAKDRSFDKQLLIIEKMVSTKKSTSEIDNQQTSNRVNSSNLNITKAELLRDSKLAAEVKTKNPSLYNKLMGGFI